MNEFLAYLHELFELVGPISERRMFGGIYADGLMFAIVFDDALYLKADAGTADRFEEAGLVPFEYTKGGKVVKLSYYTAPDEIMEDRELAAEWARRSLDAALRSQREKRRTVTGRKRR